MSPSAQAWRDVRREGAWGWEFDAAAPSAFVEAIGGSGLVPVACTVNDESMMRALIASGVGGLETDHPALLRAVVDALGVGTRRDGPFSERW